MSDKMEAKSQAGKKDEDEIEALDGQEKKRYAIEEKLDKNRYKVFDWKTGERSVFTREEIEEMEVERNGKLEGESRERIETIAIFQGWTRRDGKYQMKISVSTKKNRHHYKLEMPVEDFEYDEVRPAKTLKAVDEVKKTDGPTKKEALWAIGVEGSKKRAIKETLIDLGGENFSNPYIELKYRED